MKAHEWGRKITKTQMQPKYTDLDYAPDELLSQIRYKYKTNCLTLRCTCTKHGLTSTHAYGQCRVVSCENSEHPDIEGCP